MQKFDFTKLADLNLSNLEMLAVHNIFDKAKVNEDFWKESNQEFVENFVRCVRVSTAEGCNAVPSVVAAQGVLESGWFSTKSMFGVKATKHQVQQGEASEEKTQEVVEGQIENTVGQFFEVPSVQNNFANYFQYLARRKPGTRKFLPGDALGFLNALQSPIFAYTESGPTGCYSTAGENYIESVLSIIKSNGFQAFDHF